MNKQTYKTILNIAGNYQNMLISGQADNCHGLSSLVEELLICLYKKASGKNKTDILHLLGKQFSLGPNKNFSKAKKYFEGGLKHSKSDQDKSKFLNSLGLLYDSRRKYKKAIKYYEQSILVAKWPGLPLSNLAFLFYEINDWQKAILYASESVAALKKEKGRHCREHIPQLECIIKKSRRKLTKRKAGCSLK